MKITISLFATFLFLSKLFSQTLPVEIKNNSPYSDNDLYVAIVGVSNTTGEHIWVDCSNSSLNLMSQNYNTLAGPVYGGNYGPGQNGMYASCFTKLSDIPNKKVSLPQISGCRIFISALQPLYFYFFGSSGSPSGYTSPNHTDPTDPNKNITYEIVELTFNQLGFWGNTTRVDAYRYPMGMELFSQSYYGKTGELKNHLDIGAEFLNNVPLEFSNCFNPTNGEIIFPTKTPEFADGSIGTMPTPGPYVDYLKPYIDSVWLKYANEDLIFDAGDAGIWKGRVINDQLIMHAQSGGYAGRQGIITRKPTTQEAFEGKGVLDNVVQDAPTDLLVQAQICAALTRHIINTTSTNVGLQNWSNPLTYYSGLCNYYARFWHLPGVSYNQKSYGFAYDDVWDQSSTLHSSQPDSSIIWFGGFASNNTMVGVKQIDDNYLLVNNPAKTYFIVKSNSLEFEGDILITDISGQSIKKIPLFENNQQVDVSDMANGVYFVRLNKKVLKLVVHK